MPKHRLHKTDKELSVEQEEWITQLYRGRRSPSSGANPGDRGDVRYSLNEYDFVSECKATRNKSISLKKDVWDKIKEEAEEADKRPSLFIRFYDEETGKTTDLVVRSVYDDLELNL